MTLEVSADAPANVALRVGSGVAARADIDVQLLVAEPTGGFGDLGVAASGELGDALDSFATLLLSAGVVAVLGGRRAADARDEQRVSDSELRVPTALRRILDGGRRFRGRHRRNRRRRRSRGRGRRERHSRQGRRRRRGGNDQRKQERR